LEARGHSRFLQQGVVAFLGFGRWNVAELLLSQGQYDGLTIVPPISRRCPVSLSSALARGGPEIFSANGSVGFAVVLECLAQTRRQDQRRRGAAFASSAPTRSSWPEVAVARHTQPVAEHQASVDGGRGPARDSSAAAQSKLLSSRCRRRRRFGGRSCGRRSRGRRGRRRGLSRRCRRCRCRSSRRRRRWSVDDGVGRDRSGSSVLRVHKVDDGDEPDDRY
jgi:hypothetical protein